MADVATSIPSPQSEGGYVPVIDGVQRQTSLTPSIGANDLSSNEEYSGKRPVEPPRNSDGLMICTHSKPFSNCRDLTFDRRCEWSKHMDKHERPFHCEDPACAKLRGFTYQGGLLRHQREVHRTHGGPKEMLLCPYPYCKRSTGAGFSRRENLNEHMKRVHRPAVEAAAMAGDLAAQDGPSGTAVGDQTAPAARMVQALLSSAPAPAIVEIPPARKGRKRKHPPTPPDNPEDENGATIDVHDQLSRLQRSHEDQSQLISQLQQELHLKDMQILQLESRIEDIIEAHAARHVGGS